MSSEPEAFARSTPFFDCCVSLTPEWIPGGNIWIRQGPGHESTITVMAVHLPNPQTFNPNFDRYWYTIQGDILRQMTLQFPDEGVWIGFHQGTDVALPIPPTASIIIAAGDHAGPSGSIVLSGTMADCYPGGRP